MNVFVAGGTGFVGRAFVRHALAAGHRVKVLARSEAAAKTISDAGAEPVRGDLSSPGVWQTHVRDSEWVVHLAQPEPFGGRVSRARVERYRDLRLAMDAHLFDAAAPSARSLYVSGTSYYGDQGVELRDESSPPRPRGFGPYIEEAVNRVLRRIDDGADVVLAFPGYVYGPGSWFAEYIFGPLQRKKPMIRLSGPEHWGTMIHHDDCARALLHLLARGAGGERYFLVDDGPVLWREFYETTARVLEVPLTFRTFPAWLARLALGPISTESLHTDARLSNAKLRATGFACRFPFIEAGLVDVVHELRSR